MHLGKHLYGIIECRECEVKSCATMINNQIYQGPHATLYENVPSIDFSYFEKCENFQKMFDSFLIFAPKHRLCVLVRTASSMFWSKNKKNRYTPTYDVPQFSYIKAGFKGVYISWTCIPDKVQWPCLWLTKIAGTILFSRQKKKKNKKKIK